MLDESKEDPFLARLLTLLEITSWTM